MLPQMNDSAPAGRSFSLTKICDDAVRDERRARGGLGDDGHPREQRDGRLLREPPRREVEGVHVHGDAVTRHLHVLPEQARRAPELGPLAVDEHARVPDLGRDVGVRRERPRRAVDVELRVAARVAAVGDREADQLVAVGVQRAREPADHLASRREAHRPESRAAALPRVRERRAEIDPFGRARRDRLLRRRIHQRRRLPARPLHPLAAEMTR